jgi:type II secretory pathway pseudopilin PulG
MSGPAFSVPVSQRGFTYLAVLAALVVMGILAEKAISLTSAAMRADRESELMFRGLAYQRAIQRFYESDQGFRRYPARLEDLLRDTRFINRRHLRKLYDDPIGDAWILIQAPDGGIMGVASSSEAVPSKTANFPAGLETFEQAENYRDWTFVFQPKVSSLTLPCISDCTDGSALDAD